MAVGEVVMKKTLCTIMLLILFLIGCNQQPNGGADNAPPECADCLNHSCPPCLDCAERCEKIEMLQEEIILLQEKLRVANFEIGGLYATLETRGTCGFTFLEIIEDENTGQLYLMLYFCSETRPTRYYLSSMQGAEYNAELQESYTISIEIHGIRQMMHSHTQLNWIYPLHFEDTHIINNVPEDFEGKFHVNLFQGTSTFHVSITSCLPIHTNYTGAPIFIDENATIIKIPINICNN